MRALAWCAAAVVVGSCAAPTTAPTGDVAAGTLDSSAAELDALSSEVEVLDAAQDSAPDSGAGTDVAKDILICQAPTPIKLVNDECVECVNDTHCADSKVGPKCNDVTHKCAANSNLGDCKPCVDPWPACVQLNGAWSCVECVSDADCVGKKTPTCHPQTYTCGDATSVEPVIPQCKADSDCKNIGTTQFKLACDVPAGLCYDKSGKCNNIVAFCKQGVGSNCVDLTDPPVGWDGSGVCSCNATSAGSGGGGIDPSSDCTQITLDPSPACHAGLSCSCSDGKTPGVCFAPPKP